MTKKVRLENIVCLQGEEYDGMIVDIINGGGNENSDYVIMLYLLDWWYPGEHDENVYDATGIDTPFLGYKHNHYQDTFLVNHNSSVGYAGLSRILDVYNE